VLSIDVERERISLGVKQIEGDPFSGYIQSHEKNSLVTGTVRSVDPKGALIQLEGDMEGYLRASEVSRDRVEDIRTKLKEGDKVTAIIINIDRKNRTINLSIKARELAEEAEAMKKLAGEKQASPGTTSLGALLKAKLDVANTQQ
jgi:small subunit ribosomal protein S1